MAGLSTVAGGSAEESAKTPRRLNQEGSWSILNRFLNPTTLQLKVNPVKLDACLIVLKEICPEDCCRPTSPMIGNRQFVDLHKLFIVVKEKGVYEAVSRNRLWDSVSEEFSLGLEVSSAVLMKLLSEVEEFLPEISGPEKVDDVRTRLDRSFSDVVEFCDAEEVKHIVVELGQTMKVDLEGIIHLDSPEKMQKVTTNEKFYNFCKARKELADLGVCRNREDVYGNDLVDVKVIGPGSIDKDSFDRKRKRGSLWEVVNWITGIAKNPCDPVVGSIPEKSKWKSIGNEEMWKQVLLFREATFTKRHVETSAEQLNWQNQKMHPCLYEDSAGSMYNLRERLKCEKQILTPAKGASSESLSGSQSDVDKTCRNGGPGGMEEAEDIADKYEHKLTPLGPTFQAEVPVWIGMTSESDPNWLGAKVWPSEKVNNRYLIERDPVGKGRQDSCGCQVPGSIECVRFHISEKRSKLKLELGAAFYAWDLHKVGEEVKLCWTEEEEKRFNNVVASNTSAGTYSFWDNIFKAFPTKSRVDLVSYYYNVFLLQRRANQNRHTPNGVDSDDDESECGLRNVFGHQQQKSSSKSILISPKKSQTKLR